MFFKYNLCLENNVWNRIIIKTVHTNKKSGICRSACSSVILGQKIYIFGGYLVNDGFFNDISCITLSKPNQA